MAVLDFTEIPKPSSGPNRDSFELFGREFLEAIGFEIVEPPDRGADGRRDLIVKECRVGPGGETEVRHLVSCKHLAHSGRSVKPPDEVDLRTRLDLCSCDGFIGFYSTLCSSGLADIFNGYRSKKAFHCKIYDNELIERRLLMDEKGHKIAARFMPRSFAAWAQANLSDNLLTNYDFVRFGTLGPFIHELSINPLNDTRFYDYSGVDLTFFRAATEELDRIVKKFPDGPSRNGSLECLYKLKEFLKKHEEKDESADYLEATKTTIVLMEHCIYLSKTFPDTQLRLFLEGYAHGRAGSRFKSVALDMAVGYDRQRLA